MTVRLPRVALACAGLLALLLAPGCPKTVAPDHWLRPVPVQREAPEHWTDLERSLMPEDCGACHPAQLQAWSSSRHALATGPGVAGQLRLFGPASRASCLSCHAPLTEQQDVVEVDGEWLANPSHDPALATRGVACAGCHLRDRRVVGPPPLDGQPRDMSSLPHDGFVIDEAFTEASFCSPCHQFPAHWRAFEGKPLENTWNEWLESPQGQAGQPCQGCHMPDRLHRFAGIHDPEMTRSAFTIEARELEAAEGRVVAELVMANTGAGHHAPTYTTPRIEISLVQLDEAGEEVARSEPHVIQRAVVLGTDDDRELFDTRIPAGESRTFGFDEALVDGTAAARLEVRVLPDHHYEGLYEDLLRRHDPSSEAGLLIGRALEQAKAGRYLLWSRELGSGERRQREP